MVSKALGKYVQSLHQKKYRQRHEAFLVEGGKSVMELLSSDLETEHLLVTAEFAAQNHAQLPARLPLVIATETELTQLGTLASNTTALAVAHLPIETPLPATLPESALLLALDEVRDPGNLGTVIRTADAAGCGGVILVGDCVDPYSVEGVRATMGSIFAVQIAKATIPEFLAWRESWPGSVVGTLLTATVDHKSADYVKPALILMGNEQQGLPPELAAACDVNVKIPMRGRADSLNLSVATGIMIYTVTG